MIPQPDVVDSAIHFTFCRQALHYRIREEWPVIRQPVLSANSECRIRTGGPIHVTVLNHNINATNVANLLGWVSVNRIMPAHVPSAIEPRSWSMCITFAASIWRSRELEDQAGKDKLIHLATC